MSEVAETVLDQRATAVPRQRVRALEELLEHSRTSTTGETGRRSDYGEEVMWRSTSCECENLRLKSHRRYINGYATQDLKNRAFEPEFTGKMNFYLAVVDDQMRHPDDRPSIGLILCKAHNRVIVEYALKDATRPIGVARWELTDSLPEDLRGALPSPEQLAAGLDAAGGAGAS
jgi:hypothetical protein